jgi:hypothetical protein
MSKSLELMQHRADRMVALSERIRNNQPINLTADLVANAVELAAIGQHIVLEANERERRADDQFEQLFT